MPADNEQSLKDYSNGPYFEDFNVEQRIKHSTGRTITETDNIWFSLLTCNTNQIHFNKNYAEENFSDPPFNGKLVVNSFLVLSIVLGISTTDTSRNGIMLGLKDCKMTHPTFAGDTITAETVVLDKRQSKSHINMGIITVRTTGFKKRRVTVIEFERSFMVRKTGKEWK